MRSSGQLRAWRCIARCSGSFAPQLLLRMQMFNRRSPLRQRLRRHREPHRKRVPARSACKQIAARSQSPPEERESVYGSPDPCATLSSTLTTMAGLAVRSTTRDAQNSDHAAVPSSPSTTSGRFAANSASSASRVSIMLSAAASAVRAAARFSSSRFSRQHLRPCSIARAKQLNHLRRHIHPPRRINPRSQPECHVEPRQRLRRRIELRPPQAAPAIPPHRPAQLLRNQCRNRPVLSMQRNRIGNRRNRRHLQKTRQRLLARVRTGSRRSSSACASFSAIAAPHSPFSG